MSGTVIFHHPMPLVERGTSGSQIRPQRIRTALADLGFEVENVTGYASDRRRAVGRILEDIAEGRTFAFAYSESHTMPTLLTEPHRLPLYPFLDFGFFRQLNRYGVPVGLFYRDIYWRFEGLTHTAWHKRVVARTLYRYDWRQYLRTVDHLFLPSEAMRTFLPSRWPEDRLSALPPGTTSSAELPPAIGSRRYERPLQHLRLFYVGGVTPPAYDLTPLFQFVRDERMVRLVLCCRLPEWQGIKTYYAAGCLNNVEIIHESGTDLDDRYAQADVFVMLREQHPYLDFAAPVKLFEALGQGLPILTSAGTETARFVQEVDIGWVVSSREQFGALVDRLCRHPEEVRRKRERVLAIRGEHTWRARAEQVARTLMGRKRGTNPEVFGSRSKKAEGES